MALLFQRILVRGPSMVPALQSGQRLLVGRLPYLLARPARGDVVVFHHPTRSERLLVKRVIGVPGDRVEGSSETSVLGPSELLVAGDADLAGGRLLGPIPLASVVGRAWWCYWPVDRWGPLPPARPGLTRNQPPSQGASVTAGRP